MNLDENQVAELVNVVEEEIREMDMYSNLGSSSVYVSNISGYKVYVKLVSDDYEEEE